MLHPTDEGSSFRRAEIHSIFQHRTRCQLVTAAPSRCQLSKGCPDTAHKTAALRLPPAPFPQASALSASPSPATLPSSAPPGPHSRPRGSRSRLPEPGGAAPQAPQARSPDGPGRHTHTTRSRASIAAPPPHARLTSGAKQRGGSAHAQPEPPRPARPGAQRRSRRSGTRRARRRALGT